MWMMALVSILATVVALNGEPPKEPKRAQVQKEPLPFDDDVVDGIHLPTGLRAIKNYELAIQHCTACHGTELITNTKLSQKDWLETIRWMQKKQNLWELGKDEKPLIAYLAAAYGEDTTQGRRRALEIAESDWYVLE